MSEPRIWIVDDPERPVPQAQTLAAHDAAAASLVSSDALEGSVDADLLVVLDPSQLARATATGVDVIAVAPRFDLPFSELSRVAAVVVASDRAAAEARRRGAPPDAVHLVGPLSPDAPPEDSGPEDAGPEDSGPEAATTQNGPADGVAEPEREVAAHAGRTVIVSKRLLDDHGANAVLVQLGLVSGDVQFLFDVDLDAKVAAQLRELVPVYALRAAMFARTADASRYWGLGQLALVAPDTDDAVRAVRARLACVAVLDGARGALAAEALEAAGIARSVGALATLAVEIDGALAERRLKDAQAAAARIDVAGAPARVFSVANEVWNAALARRRSVPDGLPRTIEILSRGDTPADVEPSGPETRPGSRADGDDLDDRIERELAELKKRL